MTKLHIIFYTFFILTNLYISSYFKIQQKIHIKNKIDDNDNDDDNNNNNKK